MESRTRIIPVKVNNDITVMVEAKDLGGEQDVSTLSFQQVTDTIEAVTEAIAIVITSLKLIRELHLLSPVTAVSWGIERQCFSKL